MDSLASNIPPGAFSSSHRLSCSFPAGGTAFGADNHGACQHH